MKRVKNIERHFFIFLHFFFQNNVQTYHQKSFKLRILWWWNRIQIRKKKREINSYAVQKTVAFLCSADNVICFLYSFNSIFVVVIVFIQLFSEKTKYCSSCNCCAKPLKTLFSLKVFS